MTSPPRYPFGRPVAPRPPARATGGFFLLDASPSALHVRWSAPDGTRIDALAVDDEPVALWDGADQDARVEAWKRDVGFRAAWGGIAPTAHNGSSARWVRSNVLAPLRAAPDDVWSTSCVDTHRASRAQARTVEQRFVPFADAHGVDRPIVAGPADEAAILRDARAHHLPRVRGELRDAAPHTIVTLGDVAGQVMRELVATGSDRGTAHWPDRYGLRLRAELEGRPVAWYPLVRPRVRGLMGDAHEGWVNVRTPEAVAARPACPRCGAHGLVEILYGMPGPDAIEDARRGLVALAGCVIGIDDPDHECIECRAEVWSDGRSAPGATGW
jgi:hypothetical protein